MSAQSLIQLLVCGLIFLSIFIFGEVLFRKWKVSAEITRKIVHVLSAIVTAFLPLIISYREIILLGGLFTVFLLVSKSRHIFGSIHDVARTTYGELWFPLGVIVVAMLNPSQRVFTAAILVMGLSDTLANIVGKKWGKHTFSFWKQTKTLEGSAACFVTTFLVITALALATSVNISLLAILVKGLLVSLLVAIVEAISPYGSDNFTIPLAIALALNL